MALARFDIWVRSTIGPAAAGTQVYVCTQPATIGVPPSPLALLFSDNGGVTPVSQPLVCDGFGHANAYSTAGSYTVVVVYGGIVQQVYPDQLIGGTAGSTTILQTNGVPNTVQSLLNLKSGTGITLSADGSGGVTVTNGASITLQTNGTPNTVQTLLNLKSGTGISLSSDGIGGVTVTNGDAISVNGSNVNTPNFNGTTPASPGADQNVTWQSDGSGNVSAYVPLGRTVNAQTGTSYTVANGDNGSLVTLSNTSAVAVTLPQANTGGSFLVGWTGFFQNVNTGVVTITPTVSTINGFSSITLFEWQFCTITSDGTNYKAQIVPLASTDAPSSLSSYLTTDAGTGAARNQLIVRNINTGVGSQTKGMNVYLEHDGAASGSPNYNGFQTNVGFTFDGLTTKSQGQTEAIEILAYGAVAQATFTSVANASSGSTTYTGTIQNGAGNGLAGLTYTIAGFTNGSNNGVFTCSASTSTTMTVNNASGVAETAAATATPLTTFTLTSVANASGGSTVYTGTIPNGGSNFYSGWNFRAYGFTNAVNNGYFPCTASTATTLTLTNASGTAETHAASAVWYGIKQINVAKIRWGVSQSGNVVNSTAIQQYLPNVPANCNIESFAGFSIDSPGGPGNVWNFVAVAAGASLNSLTNVSTEIGLVATANSSPSVLGVAITATGKTAGIISSDSTVAGSFIGHGNATTLALHDGWYGGSNSPEGVVSAAVGSMFSRQDSTIGDPMYLKASGSGNTGWTPSSSIAPIVTKSATYSATNSDATILGNGTFTITLPSAPPTGKKFTVKNIGSGTITVSSAVNIDGAATVSLGTQYQSIKVQFDGTQYWILAVK